MLAGLASRGLSCVRVRVEVTGTDGRESTRLWRHDGLLSALAVAQRVRWQLDGWSSGAAAEDGPDESVCGIAMLRLVPDHLVPDEGRQLGLWGDDLISGRVERAAVRLQAMLGHESVAHPVLAGWPRDRVHRGRGRPASPRRPRPRCTRSRGQPGSSTPPVRR
jgi:protein ImuB